MAPRKVPEDQEVTIGMSVRVVIAAILIAVAFTYLTNLKQEWNAEDVISEQQLPLIERNTDPRNGWMPVSGIDKDVFIGQVFKRCENGDLFYQSMEEKSALAIVQNSPECD